MKTTNRRLVLFFCGVMILLFVGCGEKYSEQGHLLSKKINESMIAAGICSTFNECKTQLEIYGGHGNQVNYTIYNPDRKALAVLIEYVIENGIQITGGVPISISVYPKPREDYGNFFFQPNAMIKVEVTQ